MEEPISRRNAGMTDDDAGGVQSVVRLMEMSMNLCCGMSRMEDLTEIKCELQEVKEINQSLQMR